MRCHIALRPTEEIVFQPREATGIEAVDTLKRWPLMVFFQILKQLPQNRTAHGFGHEKGGGCPSNGVGNGVELVSHLAPLSIIQGQILPQGNQALLFNPGLNAFLGIGQGADSLAPVRLCFQGLEVLR